MKPFQTAKPGTTLAGYSVMAEIGRGAASVIYLVQDPKTKRIWALKHVEKENPKDQRFLDQAFKEAEIAAKIKSPYVRSIERVIKGRQLLAVNDVYVLMEYVDGISVEQHPPKDFAQAVSIFLQTAKGLHQMHETGFVHADMKPNNIVVNEAGGVKIIDLGQACAIGTVKERIQGTPDYIAPEQVHLRPITPQTDIYNLGATMYWCLTQRHIPTAMPRDDSSLVGSLDGKQIPKPTPIGELNPRVPPLLADLVNYCIEVDPEDRPDSMAVVIERLELVLAELSEQAKAPTPAK